MSFQESLHLVIYWPTFGPYHRARLRVAASFLSARNIRLTGLELASHSRTYSWESQDQVDTSFAKIAVYPNKKDSDITKIPAILQIWKELSNLNPDVIAVNGYATWVCWVIMVWGRMHSRPLILMSDSKYDDAVRYHWFEALKHILVYQFSSALCAGARHQEYLTSLGMHPRSISLGYDVVDNDYFRQESLNVRCAPEYCHTLPGLTDETPFFLSSSRFIARKNLIGLLMAYSKYSDEMEMRKHSPWRLIILGDGDQRQKLEQTISKLGISENVTLAGFCQLKDLPAYYGLARAFIHPAYQDQWGLVINEAMASGLPVFVSRSCGCVPELIIEGETGYTFDPYNESELASLMTRATIGELDLDRIGALAGEHIQQWGLDRFSEGLYSALLYSINE